MREDFLEKILLKRDGFLFWHVEIEDTIPGVCLSTRFPAKVPRGVGLAPIL